MSEEKQTHSAEPLAPAEEQPSTTEAPVDEAVVLDATEGDPIAQLQAELEAAQALAKENHNKMLRALADLDNTKKRSRREMEETRKTAIQSLLKQLLPPLDNLERAIEHAGDASGGLAEGVKMVLRQFLKALESHGAVPIDALGEPFDPQVHDALSTVETADVPEGHVAHVLHRGWMLGDRLERAAAVVVATAPKAPAEGEEG